MTNSLTPQIRAAIINYDPTQPNALSVTEFCRAHKISRSAFYKIRTRSQQESTAALHPRSRAPKQPARRYGRQVVNELVRFRKQLKADGCDYGPRTIYYEAAISETFPATTIPSPATIARLLASVGHVDASPKKRPISSYIPFVRATAMSLWQLDAFKYDLINGQTVTIYQLLDDSTRFDVGTTAHIRSENSTDTKSVLADAIAAHGAPQEVLSDNSSAFKQLRQGTIGAVDVFLASHGTMPISGCQANRRRRARTNSSPDAGAFHRREPGRNGRAAATKYSTLPCSVQLASAGPVAQRCHADSSMEPDLHSRGRFSGFDWRLCW